MRSPPLERPYQGRCYSLIIIPTLFMFIQKISGVKFIELSSFGFLSLLGQNSTVGLNSRTGSFSSLAEAEQQIAPTQQNIFSDEPSKLWEKLRMEQIKELTTQIEVSPKNLPYLFEMYEISNEENAYKLCSIVTDILREIKESPIKKPPQTTLKPSLKKKEYIINYDPSQQEPARKRALKQVTQRDLDIRKEYITTVVRRTNEEINNEAKSTIQKIEQIEPVRKVQITDKLHYIALVAPNEILKESSFWCKKQTPPVSLTK